MVWFLAALLVAACLAPVLTARSKHAPSLLAAFPAVAFAYFLTQIGSIRTGAVRTRVGAWLEPLGVDFALSLDGLSLLFALLTTGLGTLVVLYSGAYLERHEDSGRFFAALFVFMAAMLGLVLADDLIVLFVFWELTSVSSFLLIGLSHDRADARSAARRALLVTGGGGLALLAGLLLLGSAAGTWSISGIIAARDNVQASPLYLPALVLVCLGAFTKSAQFPFHFWLPGAMAAPAPVSAYLHSATMVKAGVYLLFRLDPALGGTLAWTWLLVSVGGLTMLVGSIAAVAQRDLKSILAYSTVTALGTLVTLVGLSFSASIKAGITFLLVHALYKGALFMIVGNVDKVAKSRDVDVLSGLRRSMPWTALAAWLAAASMAGLPPLFGFIGKELTYKAKLGADAAGLVLTSIAIVANALTLVAAAWVAWKPFVGEPRGRVGADVPKGMWLGPVILAAAGVGFGAYPKALIALIEPAMSAVAGAPLKAHLSLWYGMGPALVASLATFALGIAAWRLRRHIRAGLQFAAKGIPAAEQAHDVLWGALLGVAGALSRFMLRRSLAQVLFLLLAVTLCGSAWVLLAGGLAWPRWQVTSHLELVVIVAAAFGAVAAAATKSRELALVYVGLVGACAAVLFLAAGAPDLAITLIVVEALFLVVALATLRKLPQTQKESLGARGRDALLAVGLGGVVTLATWALLASPLPTEVLRHYADNSVPKGHGRNVVNVILVDFRALDTLGEIAVLGVAAMAVLGLVGPRPRVGSEAPVAPSQLLSSAARGLSPVLLLLSLWILLRGHSQPGGGFIGGLVAASAWLTAGLAGVEFVRRGPRPERLVGIGLTTALASGLGAVALGEAFLTGQWFALAGVKLGTPLLFDIGVYLTVLGFTRIVMERLGLARRAEV